MATITKKETTSGNIHYKADIRIRKAGRIIHRESKTFDRKKIAEEWAKCREIELQSHSRVEKVRHRYTNLRPMDLVEK